MKFIKISLGVLLIFFLAFSGVRALRLYQLKKEMEKRRPLKQILYERPMVVVIPSYNNSRYCIRNLRSVLEQNYHNFRILYIDDASTDDTAEKVKTFFAASSSKIPLTLILNETNRGALANLYNAIHSCRDDEIIVTLDGDDHLAHEEVLKRLNQIYSHEDIWMTYGNFLNYPAYTQTPVICSQIPYSVILSNSYRTSPWVSSHLRTFYASLFKKIALQHLLYQGRFFPMGGDLASMFPMLEMAGKHSCFVKEILYLYNRENPLNDHKVSLALQSACYRFVTALPKYSPLTALDFTAPAENSSDLLLFSRDRPLQLYALLESIEAYASHYDTLFVLYKASTEEYERAYKQVFERFVHATPLKESSESGCDFRSLFLRALFQESQSKYVAFAVDDLILTDTIDFSEAISSLQAAKAYAFYLSNGKNLTTCYMQRRAQPLPPHVALNHSVFAWQFQQGESDWRYPHTLDLGLYRKAAIEKDLKNLSFHNPTTLESNWAKKSKRKRVGLFYENSKCVNLPLNLVIPSSNRNSNIYTPQELLTLFNQGLKLDITPLRQMKNISRHIDYTPQFIRR
ncbi:MAG: hypothetical protein A3E26_05730 [Chlamydiae bacterium RIFCSPHIGHO2_12_FULL_49_32]|nr:MAG: hypothetical protein A2098_04750 [Chlamydiae bacterium GWF2_49_8]OGN64636.1 MAG: hypothetical protein A3E26_05730 [Chlamydiae bacterium RIFCSPHIGHO2_12_FULL_49_32]